jgi:hypothetical protein
MRSRGEFEGRVFAGRSESTVRICTCVMTFSLSEYFANNWNDPQTVFFEYVDGGQLVFLLRAVVSSMDQTRVTSSSFSCATQVRVAQEFVFQRLMAANCCPDAGLPLVFRCSRCKKVWSFNDSSCRDWRRCPSMETECAGWLSSRHVHDGDRESWQACQELPARRSRSRSLRRGGVVKTEERVVKQEPKD